MTYYFWGQKSDLTRGNFGWENNKKRDFLAPQRKSIVFS
jgi:hypothetical protein